MCGFFLAWITALLHVGVLHTNAILFEGKFEYETEELVTLQFNDVGRFKRSPGGSTSNPDALEVNFDAANTSISLSLKRNYGVDENMPVYVIRGNRVVMETLPPANRTAFYQDFAHGAAFIVEYTDEGLANMHGTVTIRGVQYFVERSSGTNSDSHVFDFRLRKPKTKAVSFTDPIPEGKEDGTALRKTKNVTLDDVALDNVRLDDVTLDEVTSDVPYIGSSHHIVKRSVVNHQVELLIVTDYSVYKYWYDVSTASSSAAKDLVAKQSILQFYAYVINELDMKYSNLQSSTISIDVVFAGIVIADTVASSSWTEDIVSDGKVDVVNALLNFRTWHTSASGLPGHDHAMLFSKYDFTSTVDGIVSSGVAGLAFRPGVCKTSMLSVVEDRFNYNMMTIAAHELGHNMGSPHDGIYNLTVCDSSFGYIMSPVTLTMTGDDASNPWIFSSCSVTSFEDNIATLNNEGNNCLLTLSSSHDPTALTPYDQEIPGQLTTADEQCERLEGSGSYLCRRFYSKDYSTMCHTMYCQDLASNFCFSFVPATGTTCGNQKWCERGVCVYNATAPASSGK
ncbi:ADAM family mig-17 [Mizuhopecten yessoensis]|uniref:ADAM family mig-17 n=1 Tax=Mizuhopecten yessoensis TaxID=6573 RepID=A0A210PH93_MIZYE|nr:ADAM family mig-17 [Mizuhopecten yessoensis]